MLCTPIVQRQVMNDGISKGDEGMVRRRRKAKNEHKGQNEWSTVVNVSDRLTKMTIGFGD